jgi:hypothetical protein
MTISDAMGAAIRNGGGVAACDNFIRIRRSQLEDKFLAQVRDQLPSIRTVQWAEKEIAKRLTPPAVDTSGPRRELPQVQSDLDRVVDAVAKIGFSAALESKLAELEARKQTLLAAIQGSREQFSCLTYPS